MNPSLKQGVKMIKRVLISVITIVFIHATNLGELVNPVKKLTSADITDISVSEAGTIFIATQGAGIVKSTDGGITFQRLDGSTNNLTLFNKNFSSIYARSNNIFAGGGANQFGLSPGLMVSTDGGNSFDQVGLDGEYISEVLRGPQGELYASTKGSGIHLYENNSLTSFSNGLSTENISSMYIDETDGDPFVAGGDSGLFKYDYSNLEWIQTALNLPIIAITTGDNDTIYIATKNQIYETTDYINFNVLPDLNLGGNFTFTSIAYSSPNLYVTCSPTGSENGFPLVNRLNINSGTWEDDTDGLPVNFGYPQDIVISENSKLLATTANFYSGSLAGEWGYPVTELDAGQYTSSSYNPFNGYFYAGGAQGELKVSNNINETWFKNDDNLKVGVSIKGFIHGSNGTIVLQSGAINFQQNIGDAFERRQNGLSDVFFSGLAYNSFSDILVVSGSSGLSYSNDWGLQWQPTNYSYYTDEIIYSNLRNEFYAASLDKIVRSDGNGQSFNTFVDNVSPTSLAIKDVLSDWKLGLVDYNDFFEIDSAGNKTSLGYDGLGGFGQYLETAEWSIALNTWIGTRENKIFSYNSFSSSWNQVAELDEYVFTLKTYTVEFKKEASTNDIETLLIGTYGGGMYSNAAFTSVDNNPKSNVNNYRLDQNYPNPFNPSTTINYSVPEAGLVTIKVYDILGNEIKTLVNKEESAGNYRVEFNGGDLSSGIYFYRMNAGSFTETMKFVLIK